MKYIIIYPIDHLGIKFGGIETFIKNMVKSLASNGKEVEVVGITLNNSLKVGEWHIVNFFGNKINFLPVISVKDPNKRTFIPLILKFVFGLLLHKHKINFENAILNFHRIEPLFLLSKVKAKKILFVHGNIRYFDHKYSESRWRPIRSFYYFIEKFFIKNVSKIFVVSQKGYDYYKSKYPQIADRFLFLPTWYNSEIFKKINNVERCKILRNFGIQVNDETKVLLYVGRLELSKDPILLLESFYYCLRLCYDMKLIIIGDGGLKSKMVKKVKELNIVNNVFFLGKKTAKEIALIMNVSDVFLLTSAFEGMPSVVLEALACGLPVVSTDVGEVRLVVKDGVSGKIVFSRNPKDIADAVIEIISNPPSAELCQKIVEPYKEKNVMKFLLSEIEKVAYE